MYLLLARAIQNLGDFLICDRGEKLIRELKPKEQILIGNGWQNLKEQFDFDILKDLKAIIIPGGPGIREYMYPKIYPLFPEIFRFNIPVIFLGIGSKYFPGNVNWSKRVHLSTDSKKLLQHTIDCGYSIGVRDILSKMVLMENGIKNVVINGCPAWYDLDYIGKKFESPNEIKNILVTTPSNPYNFVQMKRLIKLVKKEFSNSQILVVFHSGINVGKNKALKKLSLLNRDLIKYVLKLGCNYLDTSKNVNNFNNYHNMDLHIGYRVHGHLFFLSQRKPTFLISEDSRGTGALMTLGRLGLPSWTKITDLLYYSKYIRISIESLKKSRVPLNPFSYLISSWNLPKKILELIKLEIKNNFPGFQEIPNKIDKFYELKMKKFISNLP